jgi:uncharacterized LabA/DUF88 family protein
MAYRTFVYVDGFNLYYRAVKGTSYKWLDLKALFTSILPRNQIVAIKYYTANVSSIPDPDAPRRQQLYLDALSTIPELSIYKGNFLVSEIWAAVASNPPEFRPRPAWLNVHPMPRFVRVKKTEEKGSDVNLATHLVFDACKGLFDAAVVVSNDTDLVEPIRIVSQELKRPVGVVFPVDKPATSLLRVARFKRILRPPMLAAAQFPNPVVDPSGRAIAKPASW